MAQLENAANLDKLTDRRWRLLFPLLMETGLRLNDALHLPLDSVVLDRHQAPYLRYHNRKMKREALVPISVEMAAMIAQQAQQVRNEYRLSTMVGWAVSSWKDSSDRIGVNATATGAKTGQRVSVDRFCTCRMRCCQGRSKWGPCR